jgi:hypothetical protein
MTSVVLRWPQAHGQAFRQARTALLLLPVCAMLFSESLLAQPVVVFSEGFGDPSSVTTWTFRPDPGGALQGGGIQWSGLEGQPPGSLELVNPGGGSNTVIAISICLPFGGDQPWAASVDVMPLDPVICDIDLVNHFTDDCSDGQIGSSQGPTHQAQGEWRTLERERLLLFDPSADTTRAISLQLATSNVNQEPGSCVFDNIVITGSLAPPAVAAAGGASLAFLATLVVGVGIWLLRLR